MRDIVYVIVLLFVYDIITLSVANCPSIWQIYSLIFLDCWLGCEASATAFFTENSNVPHQTADSQNLENSFYRKGTFTCFRDFIFAHFQFEILIVTLNQKKNPNAK